MQIPDVNSPFHCLRQIFKILYFDILSMHIWLIFSDNTDDGNNNGINMFFVLSILKIGMRNMSQNLHFPRIL